MMGRLDNPNRSYDPTAIVHYMESEFDVKIDYNKAHRERWLLYVCNIIYQRIVLKRIKLASYYHVLWESNLSTVTHIEIDFHKSFHYFFLTFGASIHSYIHYLCWCSYLKGLYKDILLLATVQDVNKHIYQLAWGLWMLK